jgi:protein-S-isoprenylcysteine O-methyltransferase Ste14
VSVLPGGFIVFHWIIVAGFACAWGVLVVVWIAGAFSTKSTARSASRASRLVLFAPLVCVWLLVRMGAIPSAWLVIRPLPDNPAIQLLGLALTILGCLFAVWARVTLGSNWSGLPTVRREHELIVKGPYALARHPIYTGILLALAGSAIASDTSGWMMAWFLVLVSYTVKIRQEERLMMETFPQDYPAYRRRVKALIPGVF